MPPPRLAVPWRPSYCHDSQSGIGRCRALVIGVRVIGHPSITLFELSSLTVAAVSDWPRSVMPGLTGPKKSKTKSREIDLPASRR
jgi:hypothetical protein